MIRLEQPSIAVNDLRWTDSTGKSSVRFHMWRTWDLPKAPASRGRIVSYVAALARQAPDGTPLRNLVISCHGTPGYLWLGEGFSENDAALFCGWDGLFEVIWLKGCRVSRDVGRRFCANMAVATGARVVASTEIQTTVAVTYPYGLIDEFEGLVNIFEPEHGRIDVSVRAPSAWQGSNGIWHQNE